MILLDGLAVRWARTRYVRGYKNALQQFFR
jgi:hypothetical protein